MPGSDSALQSYPCVAAFPLTVRFSAIEFNAESKSLPNFPACVVDAEEAVVVEGCEENASITGPKSYAHQQNLPCKSIKKKSITYTKQHQNKTQITNERDNKSKCNLHKVK